jgi:3'-phosphoadenosine 5'-phosphosulfate sulfotransferase (PAPS reductase)/FAD synthetase
MEIFHAIDSCDNAGLQARFQKAMGHIERTIELYGCGALAFSFNGGKDSTVSCANISEATLGLLHEDNFDSSSHLCWELGRPSRTLALEVEV